MFFIGVISIQKFCQPLPIAIHSFIGASHTHTILIPNPPDPRDPTEGVAPFRSHEQIFPIPMTIVTGEPS